MLPGQPKYQNSNDAALRAAEHTTTAWPRDKFTLQESASHGRHSDHGGPGAARRGSARALRSSPTGPGSYPALELLAS